MQFVTVTEDNAPRLADYISKEVGKPDEASTIFATLMTHVNSFAKQGLPYVVEMDTYVARWKRENGQGLGV